MAGNQILRWLDGPGWLVLSGGTDALSDIRALALSRISAEGGVAYIGQNPGEVDALMDDLGELGAPTGFFVNVMAEDDETIRQQVGAAAMVMISGEWEAGTLHAGLVGVVAEALQTAFQRGAVILAEDVAAMIFGEVVVADSGQLMDGLSWLSGAFVVPGITSVGESQQARDVLAAKRAHIAVGVGKGSALALGPDGLVELWGQKRVTIALGSSAIEGEKSTE